MRQHQITALQGLALVKQELRQKVARRRTQAQMLAYNAVVTAMQTNHEVPAKQHTRLRTAITSQSPAQYGLRTLRSTPGAVRDEARSGAYLSFLKMIAAEQTGTRLATQPELQRLRHSARN